MPSEAEPADQARAFAALMARADHEIPLDQAALLVAAHAHPGLDVDGQLRRLDDLASGCPEPTLDGLVRHLFGDLGYRGNEQEYYDPANSYLDTVIERRVGIPISLSILVISVGHRLDVPLAPVGMPGHFLVRDRVVDEVFIDPFAGGLVLDRAGCEARFRQLHGTDAPFDDRYLEPIGPRSVVARVLSNLRAIFQSTGDRPALVWVLRLAALMPDAAAEARAELAAALAATGRLREAASQYESLAADVGGEMGQRYESSGQRLRARLN